MTTSKDGQNLSSVAAEALRALRGRAQNLDIALVSVPSTPGLYAFWGSTSALRSLRVDPSQHDGPLYIGKAERSLVSRDLKTHFATGRTGQSTLRRSLAALLREDLNLVPQPRNKMRPDGSASFALEPSSEERLTAWMVQELSISVWEKSRSVDRLRDVEEEILRTANPPLNLTHVERPWSVLVEARREMAAQSRRWRG